VGIVFKGSGWYITDSRKGTSASIGGEDSTAKADKPIESKTDTKTETKSDSASAPKTD
jgi:hypothetical protein